MRKRICLILIAWISTFAVCGQTVPDWRWAKSAIGKSNADVGTALGVDANENLYVTGVFSSDTLIFNNDTLIRFGPCCFSNIFIVKYNSSGNVVWAKLVGSSSPPQPSQSTNIKVEANGNFYLTGLFYAHTITFGNIVLTKTGNADIFIVKYDNSGNVIWAKSFGGTTGVCKSSSIAFDTNGNSYVTGFFTCPTIIIGNDTLTNTDLTGNSYDIFILKLDSIGNAVWARSAIGNNSDESRGIAVDSNGDSYITGYFGSSSITFNNTTLIIAGGSDIFIAKYDSIGNLIWAKSSGGGDWEYGNGIAIEPNGNVYITGQFRSSTVYFGNSSITNVGGDDIFIAKYDSVGNTLWVKAAGGVNHDIAHSIVVDPAGNAYIGGYFQSPIVTLSNTMVCGIQDVFIIKYDALGNALWGKSGVGTWYDFGMNIAVDLYGKSYVTGYFMSDTITFGSTLLLNSGGVIDFFVAKLDSSSITNIIKINLTNQVTLYPNPTTSQVNITSTFTIDKIEIADIIGQVVYRATPKDKNCLVQIKSQGIYFVTLTAGDQRVVRKVIVAR